MPSSARFLFQTNPFAVLALVCAIGVISGFSLYAILRRARRSPAERERRRRAMVYARGRMGDATVTDVRENLLIYTYSIGGVNYDASQDISSLKNHLPEDTSRLIGHANLRYHPQNPANSIVVCEAWTGLRAPRPAEDGAGVLTASGNLPDAGSRRME